MKRRVFLSTAMSGTMTVAGCLRFSQNTSSSGAVDTPSGQAASPTSVEQRSNPRGGSRSGNSSLSSSSPHTSSSETPDPADLPEVTVSRRWTQQDLDANAASVLDGSIYCATGSEIHAFTLDDGSAEWMSEELGSFGQPHYSAPLTVSHSDVYYGTGTEDDPAVLYALDREHGTVRWSFNGSNEMMGPAPIVAGDYLICGDYRHHYEATDGRVLGLFRKTGDVAWEKDGIDGRFDDLLEYNSTLYVGVFGGSGSVMFDLNTRTEVDGVITGKTITAMRVDGSRLFTGSSGPSNAVAFDVLEGTELWSSEVIEYTYGTPALADDVVVYIASEGVFAFDVESGDRHWYADLTDANFVSTILDGVVWIGVKNRLVGLDVSTGSLVHDRSLDGQSFVTSIEPIDGGLAVVHGGIDVFDINVA